MDVTYTAKDYARLIGMAGFSETLLKTNSFPDAPPRFVRAMYYRYHFTTAAEHRQTGCWWRRDEVGVYFPPTSLGDPSFRNLLATLGWQNE